MARIEIELPDSFPFSTDIAVMVDHINAGSHLGNDSVVRLLNEARARYLRHCGLAESDSQRGLAFVNADMGISYRSEAFYGEVLRIAVAAVGFHRCGFDLVYRMSETGSGRLVTLAKTAHILVDTVARRAQAEPAGYFDPLR